jgi:hypothetical protein
MMVVEEGLPRTWLWWIGCDGEGQVDVWIWGTNQAIESYIVLSVDIHWIKETKVTRTKSGVLIIWDENPLLPAQGEFAQVKIMLTLSSFDKDKKRQGEESRLQAQDYSYVFLSPSSLV